MKQKFALFSALLLLAVGGCSQQTTSPLDNSDVLNSQTTVEANSPDATPGEDIVITMPVFQSANDSVKKIIREFNETDNGYRLETVDYSEYYIPADGTNPKRDGYTDEGFDKLTMQVQMDIMKGGILTIVPDSIFSVNRDNGKFDILMQKGAFTDLYPFMEHDKEINTTALDTHILELSETNGKLYNLPIGYAVSTLLGPADLVGTKENWTIDELIEHYNAIQEEVSFNSATGKQYIYMTLLRENIGAFVDYENVTCSFDSPEFVKILEFINSFPEHNPYKESGNGASPYRDFIFERYITGFTSFHRIMREGDFTLVGYPSSDGCGASIDTENNRYAICANATLEQQQGAWEFLRMFMQEEYQYNMGLGYLVDETTNYREEYTFAVNTAAFERVAAEVRAKEGESNMVSAQGNEYDQGYPTEAEYHQLKTYIANITKMNAVLDRGMNQIISDELGMMYEGVHTPQETANAIQGRMAIMVSEKS